LRGLWTDARATCAPAVTSLPGSTQSFSKPALSSQCASAIAALKAAWAQGRPTTPAQWQNLQSLAQAVRTACGLTWSGGR
ncbi:MAG TPA: hypothetical protein VKE27_08090, partial [Candidatus Dormibacteraeota bacterium]|nr:hypothetical protein [Candidatus Dormibacteraeota bacterium]